MTERPKPMRDSSKVSVTEPGPDDDVIVRDRWGVLWDHVTDPADEVASWRNAQGVWKTWDHLEDPAIYVPAAARDRDMIEFEPLHYSDCDRIEVYNYGTRYGTCDCTADEDVAALAARLAAVQADLDGERRLISDLQAEYVEIEATQDRIRVRLTAERDEAWRNGMDMREQLEAAQETLQAVGDAVTTAGSAREAQLLVLAVLAGDITDGGNDD